MTVTHKPKPVNWRKLFWAGVLVAVVAYAYGEPYLEKWTGLDLPSIRDNDGNVATLDPESQSEAGNSDVRSSSNSAVNPKVSSQPSPTADSPKTTGNNSAVNTNPFLTPTGKKNRLQSPAGLVYGESRGEHRVDHVMRHAVDDKNRPVHSVFDGDKDKILRVIDEAYGLIKSKSARVRSKPDDKLDFRMAHTVDMKRKIGYLGGKRGRRENYPPRSKLTLVLDNGKFVITAYPDR